MKNSLDILHAIVLALDEVQRRNGQLPPRVPRFTDLVKQYAPDLSETEIKRVLRTPLNQTFNLTRSARKGA